MIGKSGERGSGISVLAARHDDDESRLELSLSSMARLISVATDLFISCLLPCVYVVRIFGKGKCFSCASQPKLNHFKKLYSCLLVFEIFCVEYLIFLWSLKTSFVTIEKSFTFYFIINKNLPTSLTYLAGFLILLVAIEKGSLRVTLD